MADIVIDYDNKYKKGRLICDDHILTIIRNQFSVKNTSARFRKKYNSHIPDRDYVISENGRFDFGLYYEISKFLVDKQITDIQFTEEFTNRLNCGFCSTIVSEGLSHDLRDYQSESISKALKKGFGTIVLPTGAGKSFVQAAFLECYYKNTNKTDFKCLLIVPGLSLVTQLLNDFKQYNVSFSYNGWTGGTEPDKNVNVLIVNHENLCSQFSNHKWIMDVDILLTDECHRINKDAVTTKIIGKITTPNKFGFTGTLPKSQIDEWKVIGTFGPVIYYKKSKELRDKLFLSDVEIRMIKIIHPKQKKKLEYSEEVVFIQESSTRNNIIKQLVSKINKNILILVNRLSHGDILMEYLKFDNKDTYFVYGEMPVNERMKIISKMEKQDNIICIAMSSIFSTGINIKNLPFIVFVYGGKSFIRTIQSIGRGLRLHENKKKLILFDIYDNLKYSELHSNERKKFYDEEEIEWKDFKITK